MDKKHAGRIMEQKIELGTTVIVTDKNSVFYQQKGKVCALFDYPYKHEIAVHIKRKDKPTKKAYLKIDQVVAADSMYPSSRGDLWRRIKSEKLKGEELVKTLRLMRDKGVLELHLPSN